MKEKKRIPKDIFDRVETIERKLSAAVDRGDKGLERSVYLELKNFSEGLRKRRQQHPYVLEKLGRYQEDAQKAILFYQDALILAEEMSLPKVSILRGLGELHVEIGLLDIAGYYFQEGVHQAKLSGKSREARAIRSLMEKNISSEQKLRSFLQ